MPRSSGKVFKKRRGNFNQGRISNSESTVRSDSVPQPSSASNTGLFSEAVKCLQCGATGLNLSCEENCSGGAVELDIICDICSYSYNFCSSKKCKAEIGKPSTYEVNTRIVYAMRCIGKGAEAARMFCGIMNLLPPPTKFSKYNKMLLGATKDVCDATMKDAVKEAVQEIQNIRDIPVAVDGTWQKRGYSSMNGVVTVTSVDTGKVIDTEILSKHCVCKDKKKHGPVCKKNFNGYSGRMEVDRALSIFQRSVQRYDVRYTKYLGDGDSKAFDNIVKNEVYGDNCTITKLECIGHVMKRMGSRLRRFKAKIRGQKLSDGKALCGKNRLTEASIDQLQTYYGLAIRRNLSSVKDMRQGIWAIFLHKISTDENPQHGFCPSGPDTWCRYKKAQLENKVYHHKHKLPVAVVEAIRPIFRDLSDPELLKKCLHGNTQNPNESINNVIWSRVPKKTFVHLETLSFGTYDAIASFNKGNATKLDILKKLNIEPGYYATCCM
ncbi:uncharacterized protein TNCV_4905551 [Trichonephila clavipes]|uniref:Mutator-like transposase domain-containing protein n=1 Tax=Trichonephila clavipes TaxID=2585209 RepID=A0A8X6V9F6_TRICX|nr:uncharacterized protein TNCV_4905551 [Trichonephila clavipes]